MAPRRRKPINQPLPDYTRNRAGYYSWTHPKTGREYGLGRDRQQAIKEAKQANASLAGRSTLLDRIVGTDDHTWDRWLDEYEKILAARPLAQNTRRTYRSILKRCRALVPPDTLVDDVQTLHISTALKALKEIDMQRTAQALRSFLSDCFRCAIAEGWRTDRINPVEVTDGVTVEVNRARLTLEVFAQVYAAEKTPWAKNAYALALVGAQRREDICEAQFKRDIREGAWWVDQGKTGSRLIIPLSLRLEAFGMSLGEVVSQCRTTGVVSPYLIHQTKPWGNSPVGAQIWIDTLTRHFSRGVAGLDMDWQGRDPPTFHEIRSLSERLYAAQGGVNTQELLGHKDAKSTATYHDPRGEWIRVSVRK